MILVGGFLGAGKTTLLLAAGSRLRKAGRRVGVILNDQGGELVDTRAAEAEGFAAREITGGCFCCRFSEFLRAAESFTSAEAPEFLFAEPVGSCTDLSATILQPIKRFYGDRYKLAPLTVLVDPARAEELARPDADPLISYLFRKQIAEADLVRFSKGDLHQSFPALSARTGAGIAEWLDEAVSGEITAGARLLEIDYARYAAAEGALGWLNWQGELSAERPLTPAAIVGPLLSRLDRLLTEQNIPIAHLKLFARCASGHLKASLCRNSEAPSVAGALDAPPATRHALTINLRAAGPPETLRSIVDRALGDLPVKIKVKHVEAFRPSPPMPEHRFEAVV